MIAEVIEMFPIAMDVHCTPREGMSFSWLPHTQLISMVMNQDDLLHFFMRDVSQECWWTRNASKDSLCKEFSLFPEKMYRTVSPTNDPTEKPRTITFVRGGVPLKEVICLRPRPNSSLSTRFIGPVQHGCGARRCDGATWILLKMSLATCRRRPGDGHRTSSPSPKLGLRVTSTRRPSEEP